MSAAIPSAAARPHVEVPAGRAPDAAAAQARDSAREFEAFVISQFVNTMFEGLETDPLFGGGQSEAIYRSLMADEFGRIAAKTGGFGIADSVYREMLRAQEAPTP